MRKVLLFVLVTVFIFSVVLTGCNSKTKDTTTASKGTSENLNKKPAEDSNKPVELTESPFLKGKGLPAVKDRMPKEPKISNEMSPKELDYKIGKYGGTLRTVRMDPVWDGVVWTLDTEPLLNSPSRLGEEITPNVVKSYKASADQKEFTFVLRDGMKWSDGQPVTTDDVKFQFEDVIMNKDITPIFPQWLRAGGAVDGTPATLEIADSLTFKIKFDKPYGGFPLQLTTGDYQDLIKPSHYLKKFHKKYSDPKELDKLVADAKFQPGEWYNLFNRKAPSGWNAGYPEAIGYPVLYPYVPVQDGDKRIFERNPYYFKIDKQGQQLPYIDKVESTFVQNLEMASVKILAGEVDFSYEWAPITKVALYKENEAKSGIKLLTKTTLHRTAADIFLNMTYKDPVWRKVVQDIRFRQALNLALNKKEIVDTVYYGLAKPSDMEGTEYNIDEANILLDEMGMTKGADGFRVGPDGKKFTMYFTYSNWMTAFAPTAQLISEQWKQLGLDIKLKQVENTLSDQLVSANEVEISMMFSHGPVLAMYNDWGYDRWGRLWNLYYTTNGKEGEEPPADVKKFYKLVDSIKVLPNDEAQKAREQIREEMKKNLWYFIPAEDVSQPVVINAKLKNVDDAGFQIANSFAGEQWWFGN